MIERILAWFACWPDWVWVLLAVLVFLYAVGDWSFTGLFFGARRWWTRGA